MVKLGKISMKKMDWLLLLVAVFIFGFIYWSPQNNGFVYTVSGDVNAIINGQSITEHGEKVSFTSSGVLSPHGYYNFIETKDVISINDSTSSGFNILLRMNGQHFKKGEYEVEKLEKEGAFFSLIDYWNVIENEEKNGTWQSIRKDYIGKSGTVTISEITANGISGSFDITYDLEGGWQDDYPYPGSSNETRTQLDPKEDAISVSGTFSIEF